MKQLWVKNFFNKLFLQEEYPGLEVGDKSIRYLLFSRYDLSVPEYAEVLLEPGVVEKGELKKPAAFLKAVNDLKTQLWRKSKHSMPLIVSLPSSLFFFNVLELPDISEASFDEAVRLNAKQISPLPLSEAYFDWQNLGVNLKTFQREFLIGIVPRSKVDPYLEVFHEAGFEIIALESRSLSSLRLFSYFSQTVEKNINVLVVDISQDGVGFIIGKQGKLYFDFFLYWSEISEAADGTITREDLEGILAREIRRVLEFVGTHYSETLSHFVLFSPVLKTELVEFVSQKFSLKPVNMAFPVLPAGISSDLWLGVIGAGVRGSLISRENDDFISLLPEGTEEKYQQERLVSFVSLWGKIFSFVLAGLLLVNLGVFFAVRRQKDSYQQTLSSIQKLPEVAQVKELEKEAQEFNWQLAQLAAVQQKTREWSRYLSLIFALSEKNAVRLVKISMTEDSSEIRIRAEANSQKEALDFNAALEKETDLFMKVELPLSSISQTTAGVVFDLVLFLK